MSSDQEDDSLDENELQQNLVELIEDEKIMFFNLASKLTTVMMKIRNNSTMFILNVLSENEEETKQIKLLYVEQLTVIANQIYQLADKFPEYVPELWQSKFRDLMDPELHTSDETLEITEQLLREMVEMIKPLYESACEMINKMHILTEICKDILSQSNAFQMKKNILKCVSSQLLQFKGDKNSLTKRF